MAIPKREDVNLSIEAGHGSLDLEMPMRRKGSLCMLMEGKDDDSMAWSMTCWNAALMAFSRAGEAVGWTESVTVWRASSTAKTSVGQDRFATVDG